MPLDTHTQVGTTDFIHCSFLFVTRSADSGLGAVESVETEGGRERERVGERASERESE